MEEIWKNIEGYDGLYQISSLGRVKSLVNNKEKILKLVKRKNGYLSINLKKNGIVKNLSIHRLVAYAFLENKNNLSDVNHKNEIKTDNRVENLEWVSHLQNIRYGTCIQRMKNKLINNEKLSKQVYQYDKQGTLVSIYPSTKECGRNGYNSKLISSCCRGERKSYKGFIWSYIELEF